MLESAGPFFMHKKMIKIKIDKKITDYYKNGSRKKAYELACLYFCLSRAAQTDEEILSACFEALFWLKQAGFPLWLSLIGSEINIVRGVLENMILVAQQSLNKLGVSNG